MLTVLIASRNGAKTLPKVLGSFCALQRPKGDWKLVIIDNNSSDQTKEVVSAFLNRLPLVYLFEPTLGKNAALNRGLGEVEGDLVVFTDDDSMPHEDWLVRMRAMCDTNPGFEIFAGRVVPRWQKAPPDWILNCVPLGCTFTISNPLLPQGPIGPGHVFGPNMAVRKSVFDLGHRFCVKIGPCGKSYAMGSEAEFVQRLVRAGSRCWFSPDTIVEHLIDERHLNRSWVLRRAVLFGRGCMRLDFFESPWSYETWPGLKRDLLRRLWQYTWQSFCAAMAGDQERLFRNRWELSFWYGQLVEAYKLGRESARPRLTGNT
jgi:glycosyltransferase involved in cell wall biosynthesis